MLGSPVNDLFFAEEDNESLEVDKKTYKILIVDDEELIHTITNTALKTMPFDNANIQVFSAYSTEEAKSILARHDDIALSLIDVVMETKEAGLQLVDYIRNDLKNSTIRLIIRTGQANDHPSVEVIQKYGINDFKEKTELTAERFFITILSALREYDQLTELKDKMMVVQSRHTAMGEMVSMIAHQWRQPLATISASVIHTKMKIGLGQLKLEESGEKYLTSTMNDIDECLQNLSTTIDDFRNFYKPNKKIDAMKFEEVCIKSLSIIKSSLIDHNIDLIEDYCGDEMLKMHVNEMMQVIINILKNAQDNFLEKDIKEPYIKISTHNKILSICDNGGGIPNDIIDKIFDPYFSTKDEMNGTGLGLYMSKTIVEEHHNGKLEVKNTDDGVCFTIELGIIS